MTFAAGALSPEARTAHDTIQKLKHDERMILKEMTEAARRENHKTTEQ